MINLDILFAKKSTILKIPSFCKMPTVEKFKQDATMIITQFRLSMRCAILFLSTTQIFQKRKKRQKWDLNPRSCVLINTSLYVKLGHWNNRHNQLRFFSSYDITTNHSCQLPGLSPQTNFNNGDTLTKKATKTRGFHRLPSNFHT